jgi:hypothetical protein
LLVVVVASFVTITVGDPVWNRFFILFAGFVAAPVGIAIANC